MSYQDLIITKLAWGLKLFENIKWFISRVMESDVGFYIYIKNFQCCSQIQQRRGYHFSLWGT